MSARTSLPEAVSRLGIDKFRNVLESAPDLEERDAKGCTALFRAARSGRHEHLGLLIERGADVNATDANGASPLQVAAYDGRLDCIARLAAAGADLNHCSPLRPLGHSQSALSWAVRRSPEAAFKLLSLGADPNAGSSDRDFPLHTAIGWKREEPLVRALIAAGADVNLRNAQGYTSLHSAVSVGLVPMIKLLLEAGADVNAESDQHGTPLCLALLGSNRDSEALVIALLAAKPSLTCICPSWKMIPIELAHQFGHTGAKQLLKAAGSPPVRPERDYSGAWEEEVVEMQTPEGRVKIEIHSEGTDIKPGSADVALARDVCSKLPSLCQRFGWQGSPGHWALLRGLERNAGPTTLARLAYFARGFRNAPHGEEMADGPRILGESYPEAVARLVEAGVASPLSREKAVLLSHSVDRIREVATACGLKSSGAKGQLLDRLVGDLGLDRLLRVLPPDAFFELTPSGQRSLEMRGALLAEVVAKLRHELLDLLGDGEFTWAAFIARDLDLLTSERATGAVWSDESRAAEGISLARQILASAIPDHLDCFKAGGTRLRLISASAALVGGRYNDWQDWDPALEPIVDQFDQKISPARFGKKLLNDTSDF